MMNTQRITALFGAVCLTACGGGGGYAGLSPFPSAAPSPAAVAAPPSGNAPAPAPVSAPAPAPNPAPGPLPASGGAEAEGFYSGTIRAASGNGYNLGVAILENGEIWGFYSSGGLIYGAVQGVSTSVGGTFSGSGSDYSLVNGQRYDGDFSGTYVPKVSIAGSTSTGSTFSGVYDPAYDTPALPAAIAGTWRGSVASKAGIGQGLTLIVNASGAFGGSANGCAYSGSATPRPTGKNVFNTSVTFGASPCFFAGQTLTGITVVSQGTMLTMGLLPDRSTGFLSLAKKQ